MDYSLGLERLEGSIEINNALALLSLLNHTKTTHTSGPCNPLCVCAVAMQGYTEQVLVPVILPTREVKQRLISCSAHKVEHRLACDSRH